MELQRMVNIRDQLGIEGGQLDENGVDKGRIERRRDYSTSPR